MGEGLGRSIPRRAKEGQFWPNMKCSAAEKFASIRPTARLMPPLPVESKIPTQRRDNGLAYVEVRNLPPSELLQHFLIEG